MMEAIDQWGAEHFNGYAVKSWLESNVDFCIYIAGAYLTFVSLWPVVVQTYFPPTKTSVAVLKKFWVVWNLSLSVFSFYGVSRVVPAAIGNLMSEGSLHDKFCVFREDQFYTTEVGFAMGLFSISKFPEFIDSVFLITTGKYKLPFLQWFHHVTTFLWAWSAYQEGTSIFLYGAAMNYSVHTIMYFYFAMAEAGYKNLVKPFGMYITLLQIAQMVGGLFVTSYVLMHKFSAVSAGKDHNEACPGTSFRNARVQILIYICNFYLFTKMFYYGYVKPRQPTPAANGVIDAKKQK